MRLELRITVWLTVLLGAAAALTLLGVTKVEEQNLNDASRATATLLAQTTENSLEVSMLNNAADDIRRTIHDVEEGAQIDTVAVYRRNGTPWVSSAGQQSQNLKFFVSKDGSKIVQGSVYDATNNPFKRELDRLKTEGEPNIGMPVVSR